MTRTHIKITKTNKNKNENTKCSNKNMHVLKEMITLDRYVKLNKSETSYYALSVNLSS